VIQLKDSIGTILQPATLGAGYADFLFVEMTIQLCRYSAPEWFGGGLVQPVDPQQPTLPTFLLQKIAINW